MINQPCYARGEITADDYFEGIPRRPLPDVGLMMDAGDLVWIFTETFYFSAWRMIEVLNGMGNLRFPGLGRVRGRAVRITRNNLLEHPEEKGSRNFTLSLMVTDAGPVMRSPGAILRTGTARVDPLDDSKDQGLYTAAEQLRDELRGRIDKAIAALRVGASAAT